MSNATPTFLEKFFMMVVRWNAPVGGDPNQDFSPYELPQAPVVNFLGGTISYDAVNNQIVITLPGGGGGGGGPVPIDVPVTTGGGVSTAPMPAGKAWKVLVKITTSFSAGAAAEVGYSGSPGAVLTGIDLTQPAGVYPYDVLANWPGIAPVIVTVSGAPSVGAAEFLVFGGAVET